MTTTMRALAIAALLAMTSSTAIAQGPPGQQGHPHGGPPGQVRKYGPAPGTYRVAPGAHAPQRIPPGYHVAPNGRVYYPPTVRVVGPPARIVYGPPPSWYRPYWQYPNLWWHPRGWYGRTHIWYHHGWWFEVALIGTILWLWHFNSGPAYVAGQAPPAVTCTYVDPNTGQPVYLTLIGTTCPAPVSVYVPQ